MLAIAETVCDQDTQIAEQGEEITEVSLPGTDGDFTCYPELPGVVPSSEGAVQARLSVFAARDPDEEEEEEEDLDFFADDEEEDDDFDDDEDFEDEFEEEEDEEEEADDDEL